MSFFRIPPGRYSVAQFLVLQGSCGLASKAPKTFSINFGMATWHPREENKDAMRDFDLGKMKNDESLKMFERCSQNVGLVSQSALPQSQNSKQCGRPSHWLVRNGIHQSELEGDFRTLEDESRMSRVFGC